MCPQDILALSWDDHIMDAQVNCWMRTSLPNYITYKVTYTWKLYVLLSVYFTYNLIAYSINKLYMLFKQTAIVVLILALKCARHQLDCNISAGSMTSCQKTLKTKKLLLLPSTVYLSYSIILWNITTMQAEAMVEIKLASEGIKLRAVFFIGYGCLTCIWCVMCHLASKGVP